jgi:hypothetical protein
MNSQPDARAPLREGFRGLTCKCNREEKLLAGLRKACRSRDPGQLSHRALFPTPGPTLTIQLATCRLTCCGLHRSIGAVM